MTVRRPVIIIFGAALRAGGVPPPALRRRVESATRLGATLGMTLGATSDATLGTTLDAPLGAPLDATLDAPLFMPTGGIVRYPPTEASLMTAMLREAGVPADAILAEDTARDTTDSVFACRKLLTGMTGMTGPVWACTSAYHLPRCVLLLRLAGIKAKFCPALPEAEPATLLCYRWVREFAAIIYDIFVVLAQRRTR